MGTKTTTSTTCVTLDDVQCPACAENIARFDWKNPATLEAFLNADGGVKKREHTALCHRHHRALRKAVENARKVALLPLPRSSRSRRS